MDEITRGEAPYEPPLIKLRKMDRLLRSLEAVVPRDSLKQWLETPNEGFGNSTPLQLIERGEADRIWRMLYEAESGQID